MYCPLLSVRIQTTEHEDLDLPGKADHAGPETDLLRQLWGEQLAEIPLGKGKPAYWPRWAQDMRYMHPRHMPDYYPPYQREELQQRLAQDVYELLASLDWLAQHYIEQWEQVQSEGVLYHPYPCGASLSAAGQRGIGQRVYWSALRLACWMPSPQLYVSLSIG